jgi:flagellar assembly factor FliW
MSQSEIIKIPTTRFGEIEAKPEQMMHLPLGMIGFPQLHRYLLFQHRKDSPFFWLQSMDRQDLAFVLVNPLLFEPDYQITLSSSDRKLLDLSDPNQIQVWVVVTIPHGSPESMTANLKAPVAVNLDNHIMAQIILENSDYPLKKSIKKQG